MNRDLSTPSSHHNYHIRVVQNEQEFLALEQLQQITWGRVLTTASMLTISSQLGGVVIAAFPTDQATPVGLVYGFPAMKGRELWHHSHLLAVNPEWQGCGMATALKQAQRQQVLKQGLSHMTWTFDPLVTRNAHLNLNKLGAVVCEYHPALYPAKTDLPNDRLMVEWDLSTETYAPKKSIDKGKLILQVQQDGQPSTITPAWNTQQTLWAEVPWEEPTEALRPAWRLSLREALYPALQNGYTLTGLAKANGRAFYVLETNSTIVTI